MGEEKTALELPSGYGYKYRASDRWNINYMIHDLVNRPFDVRITYDITFIPAKNTKPLTSVVPIWMDVQNGSVYPVFDVHRGAGTNGQFTYPDPKNNPYRGRQKNKFTMPIGGTFVAAGGHLHPGGLWDDLYVDRGGKSAHVFRSNAKYFEPAGPVSWDVTLGITRADWRLHVKAGDTLRLTATYDSSKRSWYEAMGIMVAWFAPNQTKGIDPFAVKPANMLVRYTHGHLPENNNHGGQVDPDSRRSGDAAERSAREATSRSTTTNTQRATSPARRRSRPCARGSRFASRTPTHPGRVAEGPGTRSPTARCLATSPPASRFQPQTRRSSSIPDNSATPAHRPPVA